MRPNAESGVWIHDCFIHSNQHAPGGYGYGVSVGDGGKARIEHNVFDNNRHSIASDGQLGTGYGAYENLVLRGGGYHLWTSAGPVDIDWDTHSFDVHGSQSCLSDWDCGPAGHQFTLFRNAFPAHGGTFSGKAKPHPEQGHVEGRLRVARPSPWVGRTRRAATRVPEE